jgi:hypothetical protein
MDLDAAAVFKRAETEKAIHEEVDAGPERGSNHFRQILMGIFGFAPSTSSDLLSSAVSRGIHGRRRPVPAAAPRERLGAYAPEILGHAIYRDYRRTLP